MGQQTAAGQTLRGLQFSGHNILDAVLATLVDSHSLGAVSRVCFHVFASISVCMDSSLQIIHSCL